MTPIQSTINLGDTGEPVSNLRLALLFLLEKGALKPSPELPTDVLQELWDGVRAEQANNAAYDSAASQVVLWLSVRHGLGAQFDGQVEDQTANLLNELLRRYGGLPGPMVFAIKGRVIWGDNTRFLPGVRIRAFAALAAGEVMLGEAETDDSGVYRIVCAASPVDGEALVLLLRAYEDRGGVLGQAERSIDSPRDVDLDVTIDAHLVEGRVIDTRGEPAPGRTVMVFDFDANLRAGWKRLLATAQSQSDGRYRCLFAPGNYLPGDEGLSPAPGFMPVPDGPGPAFPVLQARLPTGPDLWVTLQDSDDRPPLSDIIFNAGWHTLVPDLVVQAEPVAQASELERVYWLAGPRLGKTQMWELDDWHIGFLSKDCECPVEWVRALVLAARWRREVLGWVGKWQRGWADEEDRVFASWAYATGRAVPDATLTAALDRDPALNVQLVEDAVAQSRIPAQALQLRGVLVELLQDLRRRLWLTPSEGDKPSSLGDLLDIGWPGDVPTRERLASIADRLAPWRNDPTALKPGQATRLAKDLGLDEATAGRLHIMLRLDHLAGRQPEVLRLLAATPFDPLAPEPLLPLAALGRVDWCNAGQRLANSLRGGMDPDLFGRQLAARVEELMPTPTLCRTLQTHAEFQDRPVYGGLGQTLLDQPALDLMDATPEDLARATGFHEGDAELKALLGLRQLKASGLDWEATAHLVSAGITSHDDIAYLGIEGTAQRIKTLPEGAVDPVLLKVLVGMAQHNQSIAVGMLGWGISKHLAKGDSIVPVSGQADEASDDSVTRLMGLDRCASDSCLSVLSPAAYLADLSRFIEVSTAQLPALEDRLAVARGLLLDCDNTRIEKRMGDLAIEVLENAVALPRRLSAGTATVLQALQAQPVGAALVNELRTTTDAPASEFGPLVAEQELDPRRPRYGAKTWLVRDAARHWRIRLSESYWGPADLSAAGSSLDVATSSQVKAAFDAAAPLLDLAQAEPILPMLRRAFGVPNLPLGITRVEIVSRALSADGLPQWTLDMVAEGFIRLEPGSTPGSTTKLLLMTGGDANSWGCTIQLRPAAEGSPKEQSVFDAGNDANLRKRLDAGDLPASLLNAGLLDFEKRAISVAAVAGDLSEWRYSMSIRGFRIVHRPEGCELLSLVYQSVPELDGASDEPVHRNPLAYGVLSDPATTYPWLLPYDEPLMHARSLLKVAGVSRRALIEAATRPSQRTLSPAWVHEVLGISASEAAHIVAPLAGDAIWSAWGLRAAGTGYRVNDRRTGKSQQGAAWTAAHGGLLQRVSIVLQQAGLTFGELQAILATDHVNPDRTVRIVPDGECDPTLMRLEGVPAGGDFYRRMHRFVRLLRTSKWQVFELDGALRVAVAAAAAPAAIDLGVLARIQALHERLGLTVEVISTFFLDDFPGTSSARVGEGGGLEVVAALYRRMFESNEVGRELRETLRFDRFAIPAAGGPARLPDRLAAALPAVAAALGAREVDLRALLDGGIPDLTVRTLASRERLQRGAGGLLALWRNVTLMRALGLDSSEFAAACRLLGPSPFRAKATMGGPSAALLAFCSDVAFVLSADIRFTELEEVLSRPVPAAMAPVPIGATWPEPDEAAAFLAGLKSLLAGQPRPPAVEPVALSVDAAMPRLTGKPLAQLSELSALAGELGLNAGQTRALLETDYVQGSVALSFPTPAPGGTWRVDGMANSHLDRLAVFAAIRAAAAMPTLELDQALLGMQQSSTAAQVSQVSALLAVIARLGLAAWRVVAWWGGFSGRNYNANPQSDPGAAPTPESVFTRAFGNSQVWRLNAQGNELAGPPARWTDTAALAELAAALGVDPALVLSLEQRNLLPASVNLAGLKVVHRWVSLAKALGLSIDRLIFHRAQFSASKGVPTADPYASPSTLLEFLNLIGEERPAVDAVVTQVSTFSALPPDVTEALLLNWLGGHQGTPTDRAMSALLRLRMQGDAAVPSAESVTRMPEYGILRKLRAFAWLNKTWRTDARTLAWLGSDAGRGYAGLKPDAVPVAPTAGGITFTDWKRTGSLMQAARQDPAQASLIENVRHARLNEPAASMPARLRALIGDALDMPNDDVAALAARIGAAQLGPTRPATDRFEDLDPLTLTGLLGLVGECQRAGLSAADLASLVDATATQSPVPAARRALLARHSEATRTKALAEASQPVREERLAKLVDYLVWQRDLDGPGDLYEYYGIDVEVSTCRKTTRVLQAIASSQLYVQRCLLGHESQSGITPDMFDRTRAEWMVSRVVRNANLEVFLFPWRYWLPELDPEKSTARVNFEQSLTQGEATQANINLAIRRYLDEVADVSRLKVIHLHLEGSSSAGAAPDETLYLLGRTRSAPYRFYWRRCVRYGRPGMRWTGWQKIDASIDGNWPMLFVREGLVHVCWTMLSDLGSSSGRPKYRVEVGCVRQASGRWEERKLSEPAEFEGVNGLPPEAQVFSTLRPGSTGATVDVFVASTSTSFVPVTMAVSDQTWGPYWTGDPPPPSASLSLMTSIPDGKCVVSVRPTCWIKHTWKDPSASSGADKVHFESARNRHIDVRVEIQFTNAPTAYRGPTSQLAWWDGAWGRYVARFDSVGKNDPREAAVRITVSMGADDKLFSTTEKIHVVNAEHVYLIEAVFDSPLPPEEVRTADQTARYLRLCAATIADDGVPAMQSAPKSEELTPPLPALRPFRTGYLIEKPGVVDFGAGRQVDLQANSQLLPLELRLASVDTNGPPRSIWWVERGEVSALIDPSGAGLQVLPGTNGLPANVRREASEDPLSLFKGYQRNMANAAAVAPSSVPLLPSNMGGVNDPRLVPLAAFDRRFMQATDHEELFLHLPWTAASAAAQQHQHDVTRSLLRYVFDPTQTTRWQYQPFAKARSQFTLTSLYRALTSSGNSPAKTEALAQLEEWLANPFDPHAIVRMRPTEAQKAILAAYVANEKAQGDMNFRAFRQESLNTAMLHYQIAAKLLGPRPQRIASRSARTPPRTYRQLAAGQFGASALGAALPANIGAAGQATGAGPSQATQAVQQLLSLTTGYFQLPQDDALLALWDGISTQLFKLRHCQNIDGVEQEMPLLDPPIDPLLLIRARRSGLSIADALSDAYAPPSHLRFESRLALAQEIVAAALPVVNAAWATLEEAENEHLTAMRSGHELALLHLANEIKEREVKESEENLGALEQERTTLLDEIDYLARQLGTEAPLRDADGIPIIDDKMMVETASRFAIGATEVPSMGLSKADQRQLEWLNVSNNYALFSAFSRVAAKGLHLVAAVDTPRKTAWEVAALAAEASAELSSGLASNASTWQKWNELMGGFQRRHDQIKQEMRSRASKLRENQRRRAAAEIRKAIAERSRTNHLEQIEFTRKVDDYIRNGKFSNEQTKLWAHRRARTIGFSFYQLALEAAQQAEQAFRLTTGEQQTNFVDRGNWDGHYLGRFALEGLSQSLLRMKSAFVSRMPELEVTTNVSLRQLDPLALVQLRQEGACEFEVNEDVLNRFQPSPLYFQRIRALTVSMPCVVGPYTSVHARVTVLSNSYRHSNTILGGSADAPENFRTSHVARSSLLTSTGLGDAGSFEFALRGEHLLACEGAGLAKCRFHLELPKGARPFDYSTLSDVVLQLRYSARDGGEALRTALTERLGFGNALKLSEPVRVMLSVRSDFPMEWQRLTTSGVGATLKIDDACLPYWLAREFARARVALRRVSNLEVSSGGLNERDLKPGTEVGGVLLTGSTLTLPCEVKFPPLNTSKPEDHFIVLEFQ